MSIEGAMVSCPNCGKSTANAPVPPPEHGVIMRFVYGLLGVVFGAGLGSTDERPLIRCAQCHKVFRLPRVTA
jgi:hypothetical protein